MKNYRENEIKWYIFSYLLLLIGINNPDLLSSANIDPISEIGSLLSSALLAGVICTLSFVFDCLYTAWLKENLLFLGITKLPGKTIFTRISTGKIKDIRFEIKTAQEHFKDIIAHIPSGKKEKAKYENSKWYALSRKYEKDPRVETAHRDFLLCRDLYTTTVTMLVLTAAGMACKIIPADWRPIGYLAAMLVITNLAAHFKAHRFANGVIVADLNSN